MQKQMPENFHADLSNFCFVFMQRKTLVGRRPSGYNQFCASLKNTGQQNNVF